MDTLSSHKVFGGSEAITAAYATGLSPPPYTPDCNPIEKLFFKRTTLLRMAAKGSLDALCKELGRLLDTLAPSKRDNDLASSGHGF